MTETFQSSFKTLEYEKVIMKLSEHTVSKLGKEKARTIRPTNDKDYILEQLEETEDASLLMRLRGGMPLAAFEDIRPHLKRVRVQGTLNGTEVAQIGRMLRTLREIKTFFRKAEEEDIPLNRLYDKINELQTFNALEKKIFSVVDEGGYVLDDASSKLKGLRDGIKQTEGRARQKLESIVRGSQARFLTDALITMRNDRYVIPVKAENRSTFGGVVHDQSSTGQTLFIEPQSVVDLNNRLRQYQVEAKHEVDRILAELTVEIEPFREELEEHLKMLVDLDVIQAKGRFAKAIKAVKPRVSTENHVELYQARHPLLAEDEVVPNDIIIGEEYKTMIVTGPNTGGKTVALKTLGLLQLMGQSGLFIPAEEDSTMGIFSSVFADIGDEQSIEQSLSTFSSHLTTIVNVLKRMDDKSLILLDELGAGTDPQEGAALAIAILDAIAQSGSYVMITSHYPELKAYGYNRVETINASMEFNVDTLSPTYRLLIGIPGRSNAFEIARRLGLDSMIIDSAKQLMSGESQSVDQMIEDLEGKRRQAETEAGKATEELRDAQRLHRELKAEYDAYQEEKERLRKKAEKEANSYLEKKKQEAEAIIKDLRQKQLEGHMNEPLKEHEFIDAQTRLSNLKAEEESLKKNKVLNKQKKKKTLKVGDSVEVQSFGQKGTVIDKADNKHWVVQMGMLKMKLHESDLLQVAPENEPKQRVSVKRSSSAGVSTEIDVRGERVEEAVNKVDQYLDQALLANYPKVTIIHGMGTGAVRKGVHQYLKKHSQVKSYSDAPANQGGSGATIVTFK
ncbi:DNA mismatch repair protein MutS2 [Alkalibacterium putridalgicola]|uniref:Endonuclease MutS2 n=1 Tax=Alkalibacterium putridalgicola TaxID=426703 RepID=A0A1H7SLY2_9LACT|nr:endonuclease MutS2 [Alkalibacterium putridalgicola]GEK88726.1 endonuclease MutS2 [Alkalibacterium putridalgicola]SEL72447.1 DNA mismatch repair protein MutS2 [Alkalibacterium putridalgicola]